ncbi:MAG: hypothetical protein HYZ43_12290 [Flavobacteriia bacterium]|jgi:hypothetical protein|nr:hypothetical protein [Flavobacteriia bacterium]
MELIPSNQSRNNASRTKMSTFSFDLMESLKRRISLLNNDESQKRYAILIDGDMIVAPTTDLECFDEYLNFIDQNCNILEVRLFHGNSPSCVPYKFTLRDSAYFGTPQKNGLGEIEVNEKIEQVILRERQETKIALLNAQVEQLTKTYETQIEQLTQANEALKRKLKKYKKLQAKLEELQREGKTDYSELLSKGIELFGLYQSSKNGAPATQSTASIEGVSSVSIEPEKPAQTQPTEPTEFDEVIEELKAEYSDDQLINAMRATELFARHPELKSEFQAIINSKINTT